jgi:pimeloyl-ACP methyl ester carboxylesterase
MAATTTPARRQAAARALAEDTRMQPRWLSLSFAILSAAAGGCAGKSPQADRPAPATAEPSAPAVTPWAPAPEGAAGAPAAEGAAGTRAAVLAPCPDAPELRCGTIEVLEDRSKPDGRRIGIHVVVAPALSDTPRPDPLFFFAGGPGDSATSNAAGAVPEFADIRRERDLVFVDQRGTGKSNRLDCDSPGSAEDPRGYFEEHYNEEMVRRCRETLEARADLRMYTTSIAMDDVDEVRKRLGYDQINLFGGSYGTRAAQVYMRRHTEHVRSAILLGTAGMRQHLPLYHARDAQAAMDGLLAACAQDKACKKAFPRVRKELDTVIARLARAPARVKIEDPKTGGTIEVPLTRGVFAENLRFSTYSPNGGVAAPLLIHRAHAGDFTPFARITLATEPWLREALAWGMHLSVTCSEDVPFFPADIEPLVANTYLGDYRARLQQRACALWPRGEIPAGYHEPVAVPVPTLLISGALDPVTPPRWAEETVQHLPKSRHVVLAEGHHGFGGLSNGECMAGIIAKFLETADVQGLDTACVAGMKRPPFLTKMSDLDALLAALEEPPEPDAEPEAQGSSQDDQGGEGGNDTP